MSCTPEQNHLAGGLDFGQGALQGAAAFNAFLIPGAADGLEDLLRVAPASHDPIVEHQALIGRNVIEDIARMGDNEAYLVVVAVGLFLGLFSMGLEVTPQECGNRVANQCDILQIHA